METSPPNLFDCLFKFHPREDHSPKENFLTESFAYFLNTDESVRNQWLQKLLKLEHPIGVSTCEVSTRKMEIDPQTNRMLFPDLFLQGQLTNEKSFAIYSEHKWDSACNSSQLDAYLRIARQNEASLVFVGATHEQKRAAQERLHPDKCFLWEEVFDALIGLPDKSAILGEFLDFMKTQGLSPTPPLSVDTMTAFLRISESLKSLQTQASDFVQSLTSRAHKLLTNYSWDAIPQRYRSDAPTVRNQYGRVAIVFATKDWKPTITVGFLYDESDHKVKFINPTKGIDLMLRVETSPTNSTNIESVKVILDKKRKDIAAASVLLLGEQGNRNAHSFLIVRDCLADVIGDAKTEADQLAAIHARLGTWLHILFHDGTLEEGFKMAGLDSGIN